ncbi:MAG TPA: enoyl-CoA hydratase-related protein [Tetrasphaera sp.]|nr:enoyl-CoA hydratase-related protein [Tetrasphaera sp.]
MSLWRCAKPTIAKITGYCIGGGMNLAACCDLRYCNDGARFGVPAARLHVRQGLGIPHEGVGRRLRR